jgi:hypothetical protein
VKEERGRWRRSEGERAHWAPARGGEKRETHTHTQWADTIIATVTTTTCTSTTISRIIIRSSRIHSQSSAVKTNYTSRRSMRIQVWLFSSTCTFLIGVIVCYVNTSTVTITRHVIDCSIKVIKLSISPRHDSYAITGRAYRDEITCIFNM